MPKELFDAIYDHDAKRISLLLLQGANPNELLEEHPYWMPIAATIEEVAHDGPMEVMLDHQKKVLHSSLSKLSSSATRSPRYPRRDNLKVRISTGLFAACQRTASCSFPRMMKCAELWASAGRSVRSWY